MNRLILAFALSCGTLFGQSSCDAPVVDEAGVLNLGRVQYAANALAGAGADVRIRAYQSLGSFATLDQLKAFTQAKCPSWQAPDGGMKNNLVVLAVSVKDHKVGIFYGSQWKPVLDSRYNRVESEQIKPRFRDRDFTGGFVAGAKSIQGLIAESDKLSAAPELSAAPVVVQTSAPADFSGLWAVMGWIVGLGALAGLCFALIGFLGKRKKDAEAISAGKQKAIITQQQVVGLLSRLGNDFAAFEITSTDKPKVAKVKGLIDGASSRYAELKQSSTADPDQDGLTAGQYTSINDSFLDILSDLQGADYLMKHDSQDKPKAHASYDHSRGHRPSPAQPVAQSAAAPVSQSTTIFVSEPAIVYPEPYREPGLVYRAPDVYRDTPSSHSDESPSHDDSWSSSSSGGSSDWGSSSSDSGGSSDFGSSDSGGGGSSDF